MGESRDNAPSVTVRGYVFIKSKRQGAASVEMPAWQDAARRSVCTIDGRRDVENAVTLAFQTAALSIASTTAFGRYAWTVEGARYANTKSDGRNADCAPERRSAPMEDGNHCVLNVAVPKYANTLNKKKLVRNARALKYANMESRRVHVNHAVVLNCAPARGARHVKIQETKATATTVSSTSSPTSRSRATTGPRRGR